MSDGCEHKRVLQRHCLVCGNKLYTGSASTPPAPQSTHEEDTPEMQAAWEAKAESTPDERRDATPASPPAREWQCSCNYQTLVVEHSAYAQACKERDRLRRALEVARGALPSFANWDLGERAKMLAEIERVVGGKNENHK